MKLIYQTIACLSLLSFNLSFLEAKTLEVLLDHTTVETVRVEPKIDDLEISSHEYCKRIKIENIGDQPIKKCFPYTDHSPCLSLETLSKQLAKEQYPLLALFQRWNRSVIQDETAPANDCHPLDLLNFKGACSPETFSLQFIKLCNALGIKTRLANIHGKERYDFCLDDEWNFLDIGNQQIYLSLDNERLVSSEEVMDDPFLALRTKHGQKASDVDFREGWKELAHFEILESVSAMPVYIETPDLGSRVEGLDLYPRESLIFSKLEKHVRAVEHVINLDARKVPSHWQFHSPFPIQKLKNESTATITLSGRNVHVKPGQTIVFDEQGLFYLSLDFSKQAQGKLVISGSCSWSMCPSIVSGDNNIHLGSKKNPSKVLFSYVLDEALESGAITPPAVTNKVPEFDYCSPAFMLQRSSEKMDKVWWQISLDPQFKLIPSNLDHIEPFSTTISLPLISETFLNPGETYYFRVKGSLNGRWSDWSPPFAFTVNKPLAVEAVEFEELDNATYELNWERFAEETDETIEYLIYGSNSLDFIPSIYCENQVNAIVDGIVVEEESSSNLIAITTEPRLEVQGGLAYYRIIAKRRGQLSVPSRLVQVYDQDLVQPRNVLQLCEEDGQRIVAKRTLFPPSYPWSTNSLPQNTVPFRDNSLTKLQLLLRSSSSLAKNKYPYESPDVEESVWEEVRPYLLPANHPAWPKLNRVFCNTRATQSPEDFKKAGFKRYRPGRWSRVSASSHPELKEYFIKAYCDVELGILYDWRKWIHRINGAATIRACIKEHELQASFKVPHKWIYPLPKNPSPPKSSRLLRKNFILVCENMRIEEHEANEKMYKKKMNPRLMQGLYTILQSCGLNDSVYIFNIPFCKDGRIAVIDTEYHHKWPVPFHKLKKSFSKDMQAYWERITFKGGKIPDGISQPNPPRMDRRDKPEDKHKKIIAA